MIRLTCKRVNRAGRNGVNALECLQDDRDRAIDARELTHYMSVRMEDA